MIWPCRPDAEFKVWAECAKLSGLGRMCKVTWFGPNVQSYLVWAKCAKLSGLDQMCKINWLGPNVQSYLVCAKCAKLSFLTVCIF